MASEIKNKPNVLYVFGGEKAQGAEIVLERLMTFNSGLLNTHLILSPGNFAAGLQNSNKPYRISTMRCLKKLNRAQNGGIGAVIKGIRNYFLLSFRIGCYISKHNIRIVHSNTIVPASYLLPLIWYFRLLSKKVAWIWSDHDLKYFSRLDSVHAGLCFKSYDRTLVVSQAVKSKYPENMKVEVLYNGLDPQTFKPDPLVRNIFRRRWVLDEGTISIGIAASINPDKGQLELIRVFEQLSEVYPEIRLLLAGTYGADQAYNTQVMHAVQSNPKILQMGYIDDMVQFYNGCDIIINNSNNSRSESLGTSIYEAMACEKVVLASDTGGTSEIISAGMDGFLFEAENVIDLREKLAYIMENLDSLSHIRLAARKKVESKFNIKTMAGTYNRILGKYLNLTDSKASELKSAFTTHPS